MIAGVEVVPGLLEVALNALHGPVLAGTPGESFREGSRGLGEGFAGFQLDRDAALVGEDLPLEHLGPLQDLRYFLGLR